MNPHQPLWIDPRRLLKLMCVLHVACCMLCVEQVTSVGDPVISDSSVYSLTTEKFRRKLYGASVWM